MPAVTPSFVFDLESRMRLITENEYARMTQSAVIWWDKVTRLVPSVSRREIISWILNTAQIEEQGPGGNIAFDDMVLLDHSYESKSAGKGLRVKRSQFEDLDGNGVQLSREWSEQMGAQFGYWPQRQIAQLLKTGETGIAYDGQAFFSTTHPVNPYREAAGTFSNLLVGANYRIDDGVTVDVALRNLARIYAHIASLRMPNGSDPRFLRPAALIVPPTMFARAVQLTSAKFIAMAAASGGGGADVAGLIQSLGIGTPQQADELTGFEDETSFFVAAQQIAGSQLGALAYVDREPFTIRYYTGRGGGSTGVDAILDRADELEWHASGRNVAGYGHPWLLFKVRIA